MGLASFVVGVTGVVGCQVRYSHPKSLQVALNIALTVEEAEKQARRSENFYTMSVESLG